MEEKTIKFAELEHEFIQLFSSSKLEKWNFYESIEIFCKNCKNRIKIFPSHGSMHNNKLYQLDISSVFEIGIEIEGHFTIVKENDSNSCPSCKSESLNLINHKRMSFDIIKERLANLKPTSHNPIIGFKDIITDKMVVNNAFMLADDYHRLWKNIESNIGNQSIIREYKCSFLWQSGRATYIEPIDALSVFFSNAKGNPKIMTIIFRDKTNKYWYRIDLQ